MDPHILYVIIAALVIALSPQRGESATITKSSVSYLHGDGFVSGDETRNTYRFDTMNKNDYGMIYARADVTSHDDTNSSPFTRVIGHLGNGFHLAGQYQNQYKISQSALGVGYSSYSKDLTWFVDVYKGSSNYYGDSINTFGYLSYNINSNAKLSGFIETVSSNDKENVYFSQIAPMYQISKGLWVGFEHQRYFNKNGVSGLDESINQVRVTYEF